MESLGTQNVPYSSGPPLATRASALSWKNHDFLSFLSLFVSTIRDMSTDLHLATILLGPATDLQDPVNDGAFFSITIMEEEELAKNMIVSPEKLNPLPRLIALKKPLLKGDARSPSNKRMFSSMAMELQILRDGYLHHHENIVKLLGMCWQLDAEQEALPVFVLEATEFGDLQVFLSGRELTSLDEVRFCMDIASAIQAIHGRGVIHGDIKPGNILVFKNGQDSFTAKLCDFGSSVLLSTSKTGGRLPGGTKAWQSPGIDEFSQPEELLQAEIYSLGLVIWYVFASDIVYSILECDSQSLEANKASGELLVTAIEILEGQYLEESQSERGEELQLRQCILSSTLASSATERWDATAVLCCLSELMDITLGYERPAAQEIDSIALSAKASAKGKEPANLHLEKVQQSEHLSQGDQRLHQKDLESPWIKDERDENGGVFDALRSFATVQLFPPAVLSQLKAQLDFVASNDMETQLRRAKAAFQHAIITMNLLPCTDGDSPDVEKSLAMLYEAASLGDQQAQCLVSRLYEAFNHEVAFSPTVEIPWLVSGTIHGSMTARQRLKTLDCLEYERAVKILRHEYGGLGINFDIDLEALDNAINLSLTSNQYHLQRMLQILAYLGKMNDMRSVLYTGYYNVNEADAWGETALLIACRSGFSSIAELLLEFGADPTIASNEKLTPLHFLSAFDENDIPRIGMQLANCHANVEARSTSGKDFNTKFDCQFGLVEGTPLLWAVAARSLIAIETLVELGADPFDIQGGNLSVSKSWGNNVHYSPVDYAARMHQHVFLDAMLRHFRTQSAHDCAWRLNHNFRSVAPHPEFASLPLFWAVDYTSEGLLTRLILHGNQHKEACKQTIQTLIDYGSDYKEVDNQGRSALNVACSQGQPFLVAYLLDRVHDISQISPRQFLELLFNTARVNDYTSFNLVIEHSKEFNFDDDLVQHYFALTVESTNNVSFVDFYLDDQKWGSRSNQDDTEVFERAILRGNFASAQRIFENGNVNLSKRMLNETGIGDSTIFGRLIVRAKKYHNAVEKIQFFLSLTHGTDDIFFNVIQWRGAELTAFHAACVFDDHRPDLAASATGNVMDAILIWYNEARHLNGQIFGGHYAGYTALHLAVEGGNLAAVDRLLQEKEEIDTDVLTCYGESAFDMVKKRWRNQARFMVNIPVERQQAYKEEHDRKTYKLNNLMMRAGASCRKYQCMIKKVDESTILIDVFSTQTGPELTHLTSANLRLLDEAFPHGSKVIGDMKADHACLIGTGDQLFTVENEVRSQKIEGHQNAGPSEASSLSSTTAGSGSSLVVEVISSPLSRHHTAKTTMDHDLFELCDFLRRL